MKELPPGHRLGAYRIRRVAGRGAVGIVYLAEHESLGRPVAIKTISPTYANEPVFRERFSREAQGAAAVEHPNIITVFDVGETDGQPYLVMTYVDGPDLERVLNDRGGKLESAEAVLICSSIADALDAAAAQGLAHRDVKPANILLEGWDPDDRDGRRRRPHVYLTDFGLIKSSAQARVTQTGQFVGTLLYMAPEQIESRAVPASDQYSLACVLWETLTATYPFEPTGGSTLSLLSAHISHPVPRISERPGQWSAALDEVFLRALAKKPDARYPTCTAFIDDATRALGLGAAAPVVTPAAPKTAIEHTQIIPTRPPPSRGAPTAQSTPASAATSTPSRTSPSPTSPSHTSSPGAGQPGANPWAARSVADQPAAAKQDPTVPLATPAAFPSGLGRGGPAGMSGHYPSTPQPDGSRRWLIGVITLLLLVAAAIAAVLLLDGEGDTGAAADTDATSDQADQQAQEAAVTPDGEVTAATTTDAGTDATPEVPPDAQGRLAFVGDDDVWIAAADGSQAVNLTGGQIPRPRQPAWRPDHEAVLMSSAEGLRLVDVASGEVRVITDDGGDSDPAWHPDGIRIAWSRPVPEGGRDLVVLDVEGGTPQPLGIPQTHEGDGVINAFRPAFSPDGSQIAFQADLDGTLAVWVIDADGGQPAALAGTPDSRDFHPAWTPEGDVVFTSDRSGVESVWLHEVATEVERLLAAAEVPILDADVSPCGDWIAYRMDDPAGHRIGYQPIGGGEAGTLARPEGVSEISDPSWTGQPCQAA